MKRASGDGTAITEAVRGRPTGEAAQWEALRQFMVSTCGVALADDQSYLMESRLNVVARSLNFESVEAYVSAAVQPGAPPQLTAPLIDAMTTHETSWFRDAHFWQALKERILPTYNRDLGSSKQLFHVWIAACSTGQEAYSFCMSLIENAPSLYQRTAIVATDVSEAAIRQAKEGTYSMYEANRGLTPGQLQRYFERAGSGFRVRDALRQRVTFQTHNLVTQRPPGSAFDLVLMRNVLIYFPEATRRQTIQQAMAVLKPAGALGLGSTEVLPFAALAKGWYQRSL